MKEGMITEVHDYFAKGCGRCDRFETASCSARVWSTLLAELRALCRAAGLEETAKWGHPCYMHAGRNVAILGAFRDHVRLSFFEAGLMTDPASILQKQGANTAHPDMIRFDDVADVSAQAAIIRSYLAEAMDYAGRGLKAPKSTAPIALPAALQAALDADPALAHAFFALTPGRQKSYVFAINTAKQVATQERRIIKLRPKIFAGKGAQER